LVPIDFSYTTFTDLEPALNYVGGHWRLFVLVSSFFHIFYGYVCQIKLITQLLSPRKTLLSYRVLSYTTSYRLSIVTFALGRAV